MLKRSCAVVVLSFALFLQCHKNPTETLLAPIIETQPQAQGIVVGHPVFFTVVADGTPAPTYQWRKNNADLPGQTASSYTISSVALTDSGAYSVVVSNSEGTVTSDPAMLAVYTVPVITQQPASATVTLSSGDSSFSFTVAATGIPDPAYQWQLNGFPINGATSATYSKNPATNSDVGTYLVVVGNPGVAVYSDTVTLTVNP